jgi:hypothetical protein
MTQQILRYSLSTGKLRVQGLNTIEITQLQKLSGTRVCAYDCVLNGADWESLADVAQRLGYTVQVVD